jgi:membrane-bound ClpP family serine protease
MAQAGGIAFGDIAACDRLFSFVDNIETLPAILFIVGILLLSPRFSCGIRGRRGNGIAAAGGRDCTHRRVTVRSNRDDRHSSFIVAIVLWIILRSAKKGKLSKKLILWSSSRKEDGFSATSDASSLIGKEGVAITVLRPAGTGDFDGQRMDVVTEGAFIAQGTRILVIRTEGRRIVVRPIE